MSFDPRSGGFPAVKAEIDGCQSRRSLNEEVAAQRPYLPVRWLGRMEFSPALALQEELVRKKGRILP